MNNTKIAICIENFLPSGGVNFITYYAKQLSERDSFDVTVIARKFSGVNQPALLLGDELRVMSLREFQKSPKAFDLVIGTWWGTFDFAFSIEATKYAWFVQSLESRFYDRHQNLALRAGAALRIDIPAITVAPWITEYLQFEGRSAPIFSTTNGVDKSIFFPSEDVEGDNKSPIQIVIEGSTSWFKGLTNSIQGVSKVKFHADVTWFSLTNDFPENLVEMLRANELLNVTLKGEASQHEFSDQLRESDVLVKSSKVEGLPGPHIEAFHCGCTGIFTNVTGVQQYAKHLVNCLIVGFDDPDSITNWLEILNSDRRLLSELKGEALKTSHSWPSQTESAQEFVQVVAKIVESDVISPWIDRSARINWIRSIHRLGTKVLFGQPFPLNIEVSELAQEFIRAKNGISNGKK